MALEMKVYKDIHAYEAKAFSGLTFRQLGCLAVGGTLAFACFFLVSWLILANAGWQWAGWGAFIQTDEETSQLLSNATTIALFPTAAIFIPFAVYGWARPKGLKPERFIPYWFTYQISSKELCYGYDSGHSDRDAAVGSTAGTRSRSARKADKKKAPPSEH